MDILGDKLYIEMNYILIFVKFLLNSRLRGDYIITLSLYTLLPVQTQALLIVLRAFLGDLAHSETNSPWQDESSIFLGMITDFPGSFCRAERHLQCQLSSLCGHQMPMATRNDGSSLSVTRRLNRVVILLWWQWHKIWPCLHISVENLFSCWWNLISAQGISLHSLKVCLQVWRADSGWNYGCQTLQNSCPRWFLSLLDVWVSSRSPVHLPCALWRYHGYIK